MWRTAMDAVTDADEDVAEDLQVFELGQQLRAGLKTAPNEVWANDMRAALLATDGALSGGAS